MHHCTGHNIWIIHLSIWTINHVLSKTLISIITTINLCQQHFSLRDPLSTGNNILLFLSDLSFENYYMNQSTKISFVVYSRKTGTLLFHLFQAINKSLQYWRQWSTLQLEPFRKPFMSTMAIPTTHFTYRELTSSKTWLILLPGQRSHLLLSSFWNCLL